MYNMYSPTLLDTRPNRLICFLRHLDRNFYVWGDPDNIVHRNDAGLKSWKIMYSCYEHIEEYLSQYGTNEYKDFTNLTISIDDLPSTILEPEPGLESQPLSEPDLDSASRLSPSS